MTTYAIADQVPADCDYLTAGFEYPVHGGGEFFQVLSDNDYWISCQWVNDWHLNGGNWRRVER